jgi:hypothetical protein
MSSSEGLRKARTLAPERNDESFIHEFVFLSIAVGVRAFTLSHSRRLAPSPSFM